MTELTDDMMVLLCIINEYTSTNTDVTWVKELPLMAIIYQGILDGVFPDYDYSPWSVPMLDGTRQWLNISREGKDDLEDLLTLGEILLLRLSTSQYGYMTAYRLSTQGVKTVKTASEDILKKMNNLIGCDCGSMKKVFIQDRKFFFQCCGDDLIPISMDDIEDVSYESKPWLPRYLDIKRRGKK